MFTKRFGWDLAFQVDVVLLTIMMRPENIQVLSCHILNYVIWKHTMLVVSLKAARQSRASWANPTRYMNNTILLLLTCLGTWASVGWASLKPHPLAKMFCDISLLFSNARPTPYLHVVYSRTSNQPSFVFHFYLLNDSINESDCDHIYRQLHYLFIWRN